MNLIEQLGGYEKAKERLDLLQRAAKIQFGGMLSITLDKIDELNLELIQYRRQHNIFEVGDKVVYRALPHERLFSVRFVGDDEIVVYELWDEMGAKTFTEKHPYSDIDHATDEEIKAGKRFDSLKEMT